MVTLRLFTVEQGILGVMSLAEGRFTKRARQQGEFALDLLEDCRWGHRPEVHHHEATPFQQRLDHGEAICS
jgi:hypothetical protein